MGSTDKLIFTGVESFQTKRGFPLEAAFTLDEETVVITKSEAWHDEETNSWWSRVAVFKISKKEELKPPTK